MISFRWLSVCFKMISRKSNELYVSLINFNCLFSLFTGSAIAALWECINKASATYQKNKNDKKKLNEIG